MFGVGEERAGIEGIEDDEFRRAFKAGSTLCHESPATTSAPGPCFLIFLEARVDIDPDGNSGDLAADPSLVRFRSSRYKYFSYERFRKIYLR